MITIKSKWFTSLLGIKGITIFPFIITRFPNDARHMNHERIHIAQQLELLIIPFYILYFYYNIKYGYRQNPFEVEAYDNDDNLLYLNTRKPYAWINKKNKQSTR